MSKRLIARNTLLRSVSRTPKTGGKAKFTFPLTPKIARGLGWPELPDGTKGWSPEDSELSATLIELKPNNEELKAVSCVIDCQHMGDFQIIRKAKKKGKDSVKGSEKITEVMCTVTFGDPLGCAKLEAYMLSAARSEMLVVYDPQPQQDELPGTRVDMTQDEAQMPLDGVHPTPEQAAAVADIPTGEQSSPEVILVAKRVYDELEASSSPDKIIEGKIKKPVRTDSNGMLISMGSSMKTRGTRDIECYRVLTLEQYGTPNGIAPTTYHEKTDTADGAEAARNDPNGFYHGMQAAQGGVTWVLFGPPLVFREIGEQSAEEAVAEIVERRKRGRPAKEDVQ